MLAGEIGCVPAAEVEVVEAPDTYVMSRLNRSFTELPAVEQQRLRAKAKLSRAIAKIGVSKLNAFIDTCRTEGVSEGSGGVAARSGPFLIQPLAVEGYMDGRGVNTVPRQWLNKCGSQAAELAEFPGTIHVPDVCVSALAVATF